MISWWNNEFNQHDEQVIVIWNENEYECGWKRENIARIIESNSKAQRISDFYIYKYMKIFSKYNILVRLYIYFQ